MNKIITLILCLCCTLTAAWATEEEKMNASDANVFGHVLDKETGEHLPFITVILKGTTIGTTTDNSGHYFLKNLPEGKFTLEFKYLGYKTVTRDVKLEKGKTQEINVEMEEDRIALDGVVVSANRSETSRRLAPTLVNVIDSKIFKTTNAVNLAQGLNFQPGVRVETNCQNCGFQQVRINGLDGPYTQILIDSRPIFSALSGVYGLEQIPANMIDRVEVMRGGGSALFGSSAIAGTINIITKEPLRNSGELTHTLSSIGGSSSFDNNTTLNASLVTDNGKAGMYIFGQNRHRSGYDHDNDGYTELPKLKNQTVGFRSYLKTSTYSKLTFEYHHMNEYRRGGNLLDRPPHEADIAEQLEHSIDGGGLKFDLFSSDYKQRFSVFTSAQNTDRDSYYGTGQDPNAYGKTTDLTFMVGTQYSYSFDQFLFMPSDLTAGLEYNYDHLKDEMIGYNRYTNQKVHIESLFLQNEWKNKRWSFLIGARMDKHNMIDNVVFSPRANVRFNPTEDINIRASYSSGFRAPQAFDEDMHISAVGGEIAMIRRAKDLKEEKSQSLSTSVDFYHRFKNGIQVNFLVEGFYTSLNDVFVLEEIGKDEQGNIIKERRNGSGAKVMGLTLEGKSVLSSWLSLQAGATFQRSRYNEPEKWSEDENVPTEKKMFRTPNTYGYFTATLTPLKHFTASLSGTYTGSMLVQHLAGYIPMDKAVKTPDFFDMNIKLAYDFHIYKDINLEVNAGVQNIFEAYQSDFDQGPNRDSAYIYGPATPRSYFAGIKISY
ncbi:TonB-dependent receptor [Parabacteroides faecis]|uniref:TonB-dependent receptor n=1 Tax=Parabacteroides faecis TaxID=1217282 RepID=UPI0021647FFB|nr:TonB-dependent receptor [Parabacteroides faecis]MCS2890044.1 TonB-dependent receptor [Parabacteroides faecis]UVQ46258.1 TonB-dependent receptor [Parabacteroides faecis]